MPTGPLLSDKRLLSQIVSLLSTDASLRTDACTALTPLFERKFKEASDRDALLDALLPDLLAIPEAALANLCASVDEDEYEFLKSLVNMHVAAGHSVLALLHNDELAASKGISSKSKPGTHKHASNFERLISRLISFAEHPSL
eukprot:3929140-Pleurochrysis_carterae.AAC.1